MPIRILAIVAMDEGRVIGNLGKIPWHLPEDLKRFSSLTKGHTVMMGRKTYDSLPEKYKPLPERRNVVISRHAAKLQGQRGIDVWDSAISFFESCRRLETKLSSEQVWVIGGAEIYRETRPYWDEVLLTLVKGTHEGDVKFPEFEAEFELLNREDHPTYSFLHYKRVKKR